MESFKFCGLEEQESSLCYFQRFLVFKPWPNVSFRSPEIILISTKSFAIIFEVEELAPISKEEVGTEQSRTRLSINVRVC